MPLQCALVNLRTNETLELLEKKKYFVIIPLITKNSDQFLQFDFQ